MAKIKLELTEYEAERYFRKKPLINVSRLKKIKPQIWYIIVIIALCTIVLGFMFNLTQKSEYDKGYNKAKTEQSARKNAQYLQEQSLDNVWQWFAKKVLITLGYGLPILFLVMAIVWIIHGGFFKIM